MESTVENILAPAVRVVLVDVVNAAIGDHDFVGRGWETHVSCCKMEFLIVSERVQVLTTFGMGIRDYVSEEDERVWVRGGHDSCEFGGL
jgi:hypothetical protein